MINTRTLVLGGLLAVFSVIFQIIPALFSEALAVLTVFSALPIYIISRISLRNGILSFLTAFTLIMIFSVHEALLFIFTNGIVGLSLGSLQHIYGKRIIVPSLSSLLLTAALIILNFIFSIPVLGGKLMLSIPVQIFITLGFSFFYCIIYFYVSNLVFGLLSKSFKDIK